jgi:hypothetical protein
VRVLYNERERVRRERETETETERSRDKMVREEGRKEGREGGRKGERKNREKLKQRATPGNYIGISLLNPTDTSIFFESALKSVTQHWRRF